MFYVVTHLLSNWFYNLSVHFDIQLKKRAIDTERVWNSGESIPYASSHVGGTVKQW